LIQRYPEYRFIASSAQQYKWLEELYPQLFSKVRREVENGKFLVTGGSWVENDTNMPSGEALCRLEEALLYILGSGKSDTNH
jgi:alpha-mannosidase